MGTTLELPDPLFAWLKARAASEGDLPDLNVWLALACPAHHHHQHAVHSWEQQAAERVLSAR